MLETETGGSEFRVCLVGRFGQGDRAEGCVRSFRHKVFRFRDGWTLTCRVEAKCIHFSQQRKNFRNVSV